MGRCTAPISLLSRKDEDGLYCKLPAVLDCLSKPSTNKDVPLKVFPDHKTAIILYTRPVPIRVRGDGSDHLQNARPTVQPLVSFCSLTP